MSKSNNDQYNLKLIADSTTTCTEVEDELTESVIKVIMKKKKTGQARFEGEGIDFRSKIIGIEEVAEARGEKMCMDTLNKLKFIALQNLKGSNIHKQRILVNVNLNGLRILDEKTRAVLHEHAVNKISFIYRDQNDPRAFGYIYESDDGKHVFFGIKTAQAADQVVLALKDLFEVVYELKKKQLEETTDESTEISDDNKKDENDLVGGGAVNSSENKKPTFSIEENKEESGKKSNNTTSDELFDMFDSLGLTTAGDESLTNIASVAPQQQSSPWNTPSPQLTTTTNPNQNKELTFKNPPPSFFDSDQQQQQLQQGTASTSSPSPFSATPAIPQRSNTEFLSPTNSSTPKDPFSTLDPLSKDAMMGGIMNAAGPNTQMKSPFSKMGPSINDMKQQNTNQSNNDINPFA